MFGKFSGAQISKTASKRNKEYQEYKSGFSCVWNAASVDTRHTVKVSVFDHFLLSHNFIKEI